MKKTIISLLVILITLTGCNTSGSGFSLVKRTPTLTPGQEFCTNYTASQTEMDNFQAAKNNFLNFLASEIEGVQWSLFIETATLLGPSSVEGLKKVYPSEYEKIVGITNEVINSAIELQIALYRAQIPPEISFSHQKVIDCVEQTSDFSTSLQNFFTDGSVLDTFNNLAACENVRLYYDEITEYCSNQ